MTQDDIKAVLDRVLTWPREKQEAAAALLASLEERDDEDAYQLTREQAEEVRRRLADPHPKTIPIDEVFARLRSRLG